MAHVKRSRVRAMSMFDAGDAEGEMAHNDPSYLEYHYASDVARLQEVFGLETAMWQRTRTTPEPLPSTQA